MTAEYEVTVIGSGPGGYISAIRCAQLGMKVALVEKYPNLGGTCLNVGCIPSKALLDSSEHYHNAISGLAGHGIECAQVKLDFAKLMARKEKVVATTSAGVKYLMKKNKIDTFCGRGSLVDAGTIAIAGKDGGNEQIRTDRIIIATGSKPSTLPGIELDKKQVISSTEALGLTNLPRSMVIIGGGIIGVELGSVYARLGVRIVIVEYLNTLIGTMDSSLGKELHKSMDALGITCALGHKVEGVDRSEQSVKVRAISPEGEKAEFEGEYCLVAVGRKPYTEGLELDNVGIELDQRGCIPVSNTLETSVKGIYAIGDVVRGPMLAHKAEEEGVYVAELLAGQKPHINYDVIPSVAYTWPEVASTGATEDALKKAGREYKVGVFPFKALGRARAANETEGFVKVLADSQTDELLGVHIIGARASDLIGEAVLALEYRATAEDVARTSHAHPTFSEAFKEACLAATDNRALNI